MEKKNMWILLVGLVVMGGVCIGITDDTYDTYDTQETTEIPPIPKDYYNGVCLIHKVTPSLTEWLTEIKWANKYEEEGKWDCSRMAASQEWYLENCGYETVMVLGTGPRGSRHMWLKIWLPEGTIISKLGHRATKDGYYIYEATERFVVSDKPGELPNYKAERTFTDIYAVWEYSKDFCNKAGDCGDDYFLAEYGWWE